MVPRRRTIAQERRRLIAIHDNDVDIAIIIEAPKSSSATLMLGGNGGPGLIAQFYKSAIVLVAEENA